MYLIKPLEIENGLGSRNSQGGAAFLPMGFDLPKCSLCGEEMCLFFQFEVREEYQIPFPAGSQVSIFMCPVHNDIPEASTVHKGENPKDYKNQAPGHYKLLMFPPKSDFVFKPQKNDYIAGRKLSFERGMEKIEDFGHGIQSGLEAFKVGGQPSWINYANKSHCSCGAKMEFICQLPENYGFKKTEEAPEQPDSFSSTEYCLFLGNIVFIMGCTDCCSETSLVGDCDN